MKSDLTYERLLRGELSSPLEPDDQHHLEAMAAEDRAFLEAFPSPPQAKAPVRPPKRREAWWGIGGLAAAVLVVLVLPLGSPAPDTRAKGASLSLMVYHKTESGTELLGPASRLGKDDEIQLAYFSATKQYAAILSVDGRGTVTTHFPLNTNQALETDTPKPELLPYSYRLDDAPDFETVVLVASGQPFLVSRIRPFLKGLVAGKEDQLNLPSEFTYTAFRIGKKETSR